MKSMKKTFTILSLFLFFAVFSSQTKAQVLPEFGIKGGVNYATFNDAENFNAEYKAGVLLGAYMKFNVPASPMAIQPEVLYAQYGAADEDSDVQFNVNYVQIPVLLKFSFDSPGAKPNVFFGPYVGFNTKAEVKNETVGFNLEDDANSTTYGVVVGAGIDVSKIRLGLRYTAGLSNVANDDFDSSAKNGALALTVGVGF